ncbi:malto-oligosyltrehalose synthase [Ornithinimicrobium humiphilum]|uniref:Maltooligosyl trehalose synthase n=1 Tax=Ornithinimicrobium humiphilum TaxID=125288 RepID=A0A543K7H1_9MICO|nr:malto-oligosyltrehalose synthase [Ornithinimicrobium humiphilum]TQM91042.1 maltooligosyl trehalose synthase [Ornithinimicrobium humiphilum]
MTHPDPSGRRPLTATYRMQLHSGFPFTDALGVLPYVEALGVSHVYLSPVLTATPGSEHGYDVLDHTTVSPELGGRAGLERLAAETHARGMGVVVDIVPNHMAIVPEVWRNAPLWEVLSRGRHAPRAHWFDVDWDHLGGRFGLPVLGRPLEEVLADGELTVGTGRDDEGPAAGTPVLRYYEHVLPLAPGTADLADDLPALLEAQHWQLACWLEAPEVLNYRRFFEVSSLLGVRVEEPDVFEATHAELLDLHHAGVVDGFRIDHPDGLADPQGYLAMLRDRLRPGSPVWVEKILEGTERLPSDWACHGTTGYDANAAVLGAMVDPTTASAVSTAWFATGGEPDLEVEVERCKRLAVETLLRPEVGRLVRRAREALPGHDEHRLRAALGELLVGVHVYRAYVRPDDPADRTSSDDPERPLLEALSRARLTRPDLDTELVDLAEVLRRPGSGAARDLCVRFQQTTGPVMAKGIEDTAFYRWHRLVALNEVGADPAVGEHPEDAVERLHTWARHQAEHWPLGMTTLSTHDTKRSEDVRARILAVAGDADAWRELSAASAAAASRHGVDAPTAHLVWQTLVGAGRVAHDRLHDYLIKAVREAKLHSTWIEPDEDYEARVLALADEMVGEDGEVSTAIGAAVRDNYPTIRTLTLAQKVIQLTLPGVPDTYQGTGLVDLSLVDPDNRRPVDYAERVERLRRLDETGDRTDLSDEVLWVTSRVLRLRSWLPQAYGPGASYEPVAADPSPHVLGFLRGGVAATLTLRAPRALGAAGGLGQTRVLLPPGHWRDALSGADHHVGDEGVLAVDVFATAPAAVLVRATDLEEGPR